MINKFIILTIITFIYLANFAFADIWQDTSKVSSMNNDTNKVNFILSLSERLFDFDTDLGIYYGKMGLDLSFLLNYKSGIARSYKSFGINYWRMGVYDLAIENLFTSIKFYKELKDDLSICKSYNNIGLIYMARVDVNKANQYFKMGLEIALRINNLIEQSRIKHNMGLTEFEYGNKEIGLKLFKESYSLATTAKDERLMAFNEVFLGRGFTHYKNYDSARVYIDKGIERFDKLNAPNNVAMAYNQLAELLIAQGKFNEAIAFANKAADFGKTIGNKYLLMESSKIISNAFIGLNDFKNALKFKEKYHLLSDSMMNAANIKSITEKEAQFKYEQQIMEIKAQKEKEIFKIQMIVVILIIITLTILIFLTWKHNLNKRLKSQNEEIMFLNEELKYLNSTKDKFFSIIAHDLKNPIGNFKNITQMIHENFDDIDSDELKEYLGLIKNSSETINDLLLNLLEWSKSKRGLIQFHAQEVSLYRIFKNINDLMLIQASNKRINLQINLKDDIKFLADPNLLHTVIRNLISNSIKFTNEGGTVEFGAKQENLNVLIYIKDNGIGISKELQEKLFKIESNFTTEGTNHEKGTGLGLILCKEFIDMHKGEIWVESEFNKGSTFWIKLPYLT